MLWPLSLPPQSIDPNSRLSFQLSVVIAPFLRLLSTVEKTECPVFKKPVQPFSIPVPSFWPFFGVPGRRRHHSAHSKLSMVASSSSTVRANFCSAQPYPTSVPVLASTEFIGQHMSAGHFSPFPVHPGQPPGCNLASSSPTWAPIHPHPLQPTPCNFRRKNVSSFLFHKRTRSKLDDWKIPLI